MTAPRLPPRPTLTWRENAPYSEDAADIYFAGDGLAEARAVFLTGCGLPERWAKRERFVIGELGFGSGLNFLAAWDLWRRTRPSPTARLVFASIEGAPMESADARRVHAPWPEIADLSQTLVASWPDRARGVQAVDLPDGVRLILSIDDVERALAALDLRADAWFLDGFAPARNPQMWSEAVFHGLQERSAPDVRLASYTVAGDVRRGLSAAGFSVEKRPGHGGKRERLEARSYRPAITPVAAPDDAPPRRVVVIGAGVAGAWAARAFLDRECAVTVLDRHGEPAGGASGNPIALVMPRLDATDTPTARALIAAFLYARRAWTSLGDGVQGLEVERRPANETERRRFQKLLADPPLDRSFLSAWAESDPDAGLRLGGCVAIAPQIALPTVIEGARFVGGADVVRIDRASSALRLYLRTGDTLDADCVVVCAGDGVASITGLRAPPIERRLGQVESARHAGPHAGPRAAPPWAIADGAYTVAAFNTLLFGATFEPAGDGPPSISENARQKNLAALGRLLPGVSPSSDQLTSRAGVRSTTRDRLPFAGPFAEDQGDHDGRILFLGGMGARGFLWSPMLADMLAAEVVVGEPCPVEIPVRQLLRPDRLL